MDYATIGCIAVVPDLSTIDEYLRNVARRPFLGTDVTEVIFIMDGDLNQTALYETFVERIWKTYGILKLITVIQMDDV